MHRRLEQVGKGQSIREVSDFYPDIIVFSGTALWSRCETGDVDCWEWNGT